MKFPRLGVCPHPTLGPPRHLCSLQASANVGAEGRATPRGTAPGDVPSPAPGSPSGVFTPSQPFAEELAAAGNRTFIEEP